MERPGDKIKGPSVPTSFLQTEIRREILSSPQGKISFRRFMELALYHPSHGYYCRQGAKIGREGDFYTSPLVGDVFGKTLGSWLARLTAAWPSDQSWWLVEAGPGDGRMARDVLAGLLEGARHHDTRLPEVYGLVELSPWHRRLQEERLGESPLPLRWLTDVDELPAETPVVLISNEFFDAFPVRRVVATGDGLQEIHVALRSDRFVERVAPPARSCLEYLEEMGWPPLETGAEMEVPVDAGVWYRRWAEGINRGWMVTIDYGGTMEELSRPMYQRGTLRGFRRHRLVEDPLEAPGEVDLTSHVHFSALKEWGKEAGWETFLFTSQDRFLLQAGILNHVQADGGADPFSPAAKRNRAIRQLALPGGMGEVFRVLVQGKETGGLSLPEPCQ